MPRINKLKNAVEVSITLSKPDLDKLMELSGIDTKSGAVRWAVKKALEGAGS